MTTTTFRITGSPLAQRLALAAKLVDERPGDARELLLDTCVELASLLETQGVKFERNRWERLVACQDGILPARCPGCGNQIAVEPPWSKCESCGTVIACYVIAPEGGNEDAWRKRAELYARKWATVMHEVRFLRGLAQTHYERSAFQVVEDLMHKVEVASEVQIGMFERETRGGGL